MLSDRFLERVQVEDRHVNILHLLSEHVGFMLCVSANRQESPVNHGVQRLDSAIQALWRSRKLGDVRDGESSLAQGGGSSSSREQMNIAAGQKGGEFDNTGLVRN